MEGAAAVAVSAADTGVRFDRKGLIVAFGQPIIRFGKVVVFVDQPHIQPGGTGLAVVAVNAFSLRVLRGKGTENGVILFLL